MAIFTKPKLLFIFFLILSLVLVSQCYDDQNSRGDQDPQEKLRECQQRCERQQPGQQKQLCKQRCEQQYKKEQQQHGRETGEDDLGNRGPEKRYRKFQECQRRCQSEEQGQQLQECQQRCQQEYQREKGQQVETNPEWEQQEKSNNPYLFESQRFMSRYRASHGNRGPEKRYRKFQECQRRCQSEEQGQQLQECQQRCQQEYQREKGQQVETNPEWEQQEKSNNPYLFESQRFRSRYRASHGDFRILEKFNQRSQLLKGIEKYRVSVLELEPQSFVLPHHCDGEAIYVVVKGQGIISIAEQDNKNSFNLQKGDVIRVRAGSNVYMLNKDNNEKFFVYVLAKSVNAPGNLQQYFSAGGQNPETFYKAFSSDILESAFNNPRDKLERLFGQHKEGIIIKASEEQIRAISEHASRSTQQTKGRTQGPFNLLKERPLFESKFGQFFEACPERFEQLRDLDAAVAFMNINQGGMVLPYYNTKSTKLVMVVEGNARFEMACPHLGRQGQSPWSRGQGREQEQEQEQEEGEVHYQKIRGNLNVGDVLVIPAGHPITFVATGSSNVRIVGFGVDAENSKKNFLAGKQSIWRNVDREAKELSFSMPGREVEEIFQKQDQSYFVAGPEHPQGERGEEGRRGQDQYLSSILDFVF